jgi:hypothetical protein
VGHFGRTTGALEHPHHHVLRSCLREDQRVLGQVAHGHGLPAREGMVPRADGHEFIGRERQRVQGGLRQHDGADLHPALHQVLFDVRIRAFGDVHFHAGVARRNFSSSGGNSRREVLGPIEPMRRRPVCRPAEADATDCHLLQRGKDIPRMRQGELAGVRQHDAGRHAIHDFASQPLSRARSAWLVAERSCRSWSRPRRCWTSRQGHQQFQLAQGGEAASERIENGFN